MSLNAATIELLLAKGLTGDDLLEVARAMERRRDNTNAERQARYREKRNTRKSNARYSNGVTPPNDNTLTPGEEANASPQIWVCPDGVADQVWKDLLSNRKRKRLPNTDTAWKAFNDDLCRISAQTGIPPPDLIRRCTARGWGAIYDPNGRNSANDQQCGGISKSAAAFAALNPSDDLPM